MTEMKNRYSTAAVMKIFEIGRNTLRLYEEMGLLVGMKRTEAGYREYNQTHLEDLQFIFRAKEAGFTLNEIKTLLSTVRSKKSLTCGSVSEEISTKIQEINMELRALQSKKEFLGQFLKTCHSKPQDNKCDVVGVGFNKTACCSQ